MAERAGEAAEGEAARGQGEAARGATADVAGERVRRGDWIHGGARRARADDGEDDVVEGVDDVGDVFGVHVDFSGDAYGSEYAAAGPSGGFIHKVGVRVDEMGRRDGSECAGVDGEGCVRWFGASCGGCGMG